MGSGPSGPQSCSKFKTIFGYYSLNFDRYENVNHNDVVRELARHRASSTLTWLGRHAPVVQPLGYGSAHVYFVRCFVRSRLERRFSLRNISAG